MGDGVSRDIKNVEVCFESAFTINSLSSVQDKKSQRRGRANYPKTHYSEKLSRLFSWSSFHVGLGSVREGTAFSS